MSRELVDITCRVIVETDKAYRIDDGAISCWLPKSQVEWHPAVPGKTIGTMVVPEFIAKEKGLI
jgi:hypothetical protein